MIEKITYENAVAVTPSDFTDDPAGPFAAFYVGTTGNVKVRTFRGNDVVFKNVPQGTTIRVAIKRVWSTGSGTPADVVGLTAMPYKGAG